MNRSIERMKWIETGIQTLCGAQGCCPTIDFSNAGHVVIKDDYGGTVRISRPAWKEFKRHILEQVEAGTQTVFRGHNCYLRIDFTNAECVIIKDDLLGTVRLSRPEWDELKRLIRDT